MCECAEYQHLEFLRKVISARIRASRTLKERLRLVATHPGRRHQLYCCPECRQTWQASWAWNWGNREYLFKVPPVEPTEWTAEPYVQPDELLIYVAVMEQFLSKNKFEDGIRRCAVDGCKRMAAAGIGTCLRHHIENLQEMRMLPSLPRGRWFPPYERDAIEFVVP